MPPIALFENNTAAFVHDLAPDSLSNVAGASNYVRVQVLTPVGVLDRDKQLGVVRELTNIVAAAARDATLADRTWVLITESRRRVGHQRPRQHRRRHRRRGPARTGQQGDGATVMTTRPTIVLVHGVAHH